MIKYLATASLVFLLSSQVMANSSPKTIQFNENDKIPLELSSNAFSKVKVQGEIITDLYFVDGTFNLSYMEPSEDIKKRDDGAVYIVPQTENSPVLYVTTNKGHHFSVEVKPADKVGETLIFSFKRRVKPRAKVKPIVRISPEEVQLKAMISGKIPPNFQGGSVKGKRFNYDKTLTLQLVRFYKNDTQKVYMYRAMNTGSKERQLNPEMFSEKNVKAVVLDKTRLKPRQSMMVYSLAQGVAR